MSHSSVPRPRACPPVALCAVFLTLLAGGLRANDDAPTRLLNAEMPRGTSLETASCSEMVFATRQAVRKHPSEATAIMQRAIGSRVAPGDRPTPQTRSAARNDKNVVVPCECLTRIVQAALESAPSNKVHELIETAMALQPQCAEEITGLLHRPRIDGKDGPAAASNHGGRRGGPGYGDPGSGVGDPGRGPGTDFGDRLLGGGTDVGYGGISDGANTFAGGPGFPGSPGSFGSAPSGGNALFPPVVLTPLTNVANP